MPMKFTSTLSTSWADKKEKQFIAAGLQMATDILRFAVVLGPKDTRALVNSGRIESPKPGQYDVVFGGGPVPYARRRHFENKKNPQTLGYLNRAGKAVSKNKSKYIKGERPTVK